MANAPAAAPPAAIPAPMASLLQEMQLDPTKCNVLVPTDTFGRVLGKFQKLVLEVLYLSPDAKNGKDCYSPGGSGLALTGHALTKIAHACGVQWSPEYTTVIESTPERSRAKATGAMQMPNGQWEVWSDEKTIDIDVVADELELEMTKFKKYKGRDDLDFRRRLLQKRKFKDELAMSGAMNRVIRRLIQLNRTFTAAEMRLPFVVPRALVDMDKVAADPEMRQAALRSLDESAGRIFGGGARDSSVPGGDEPGAGGEVDPGLLSLPDSAEAAENVDGTVQDAEEDEGFPPSESEEEPSPAQAVVEWIEAHKTHAKLDERQQAYVQKILDQGAPLADLEKLQKQVAAEIGEKL